jgi:phenylalanyl-tRNA synthetase alpha chain
MAPDLPTQVLHALYNASTLPLISTLAFPDTESTVLKGALDSLQSREMVIYETLEREAAILTEEGEGISNEGSHEAKVYNAVCNAIGGLKINDLAVSFPNGFHFGRE